MAHEQTSGSETDDILLYILSFFIPPIPVLMREGCGFHFFLNIILTILAGFPGIIHAIYIVYKTSYKKRGGNKRAADYEHGASGAQHHQGKPQHHGQPQQQQYNQAPPQSQGQYAQQQHHQAPPVQQQQQQQYSQPQQGQYSNAPAGNTHQAPPPNYGAAAQDSYPSDHKAQYKP